MPEAAKASTTRLRPRAFAAALRAARWPSETTTTSGRTSPEPLVVVSRATAVTPAAGGRGEGPVPPGFDDAQPAHVVRRCRHQSERHRQTLKNTDRRTR